MKILNNLDISIISGGAISTCELKNGALIFYNEAFVRSEVISWCCDTNDGKIWRNKQEGGFCSTFMGGVTPVYEGSEY